MDIITVPSGMSYINAFTALWLAAVPQSKQQRMNSKAVDNPKKIQNLMLQMTTLQLVVTNNKRNIVHFKCFIAVVGGKQLNVDFARFPEIQIAGYDALYGHRAAKKALDDYHNLADDKKMDRGYRHFSELMDILATPFLHSKL